MIAYFRFLGDIPLPAGFAAVGATAGGAIGAIAGLIIGIHAYAPTAPFAVLELGLPAMIVGGLAGLITGLISALVGKAARRINRRPPFGSRSS